MLAGFLKTSRIGSSIAHPSSFYIPAGIQVQQKRFKRNGITVRKTDFFADPLIREDEYDDAKKTGLIEELKYRVIRFAPKDKTTSVFYDKDEVRLRTELMRHGKKELAHKLVHETMYEIKCIQIAKKRKAEMKKKEEEENSDSKKVKSASSLAEAEETVETNPLSIFHKALKNMEPQVVTMPIKRGSVVYQVPLPVTRKDAEFLTFKWLVRTIKERPKPRMKPFPYHCSREIIDAFNNDGKVVKKKDDIHKLADANRAYAHFRWG